MKSNWVLLLLLASLLCTIVPGSSHGKQGDALTRLMKAKRNAGSNFIDVSLYDAGALTSDVAIVPQVGSKENDKIVKLPGQPDVDFNQYGGYITVNEKAGRALFYYFAEATGYQQSSKPLLLWLNGGPGCSSLAYGAMEELGPFRVSSDGETLNRNPYSWNKVANVLFLESPAGVGFSYSNRTEDYKTSGDKMTAQDAFVFLVNWLERFPEYKNREFYIAGESYAGHYVPQLGHAILKHNEAAKRTLVNLKGVMIGNAVINDETDSLGMYEFFWTHALISDEDWQQIRTNCDFAPNVTKQSANCNKATDEADIDLDDLDIYNIYAPLCHSTNTTLKPKKSSVMKFDPCSDYYVIKYLNLPKVQKALHANVTKVNFSWQPCSDVITKWADSPSTILPLLQEFLAKGIRVWVFSGDTDGRVPITGTRYSLNVLKLPVKTQWKPWYVNDEIGGYSVVYKGDLVLATVRGAGHMVPSYQPRRALVLANSFLQGKPLPPQ